MTSTPSTPKYRAVERALRQEIEFGKWQPGERLPGEHEIARQFDVAYLTVRQAVAQLVDQGVLLRVRGKGTYLASTISVPGPTHPASGPMALLFRADWQINDPYYFPDLLRGFQQTMEAHYLRITMYDYADVENAGVLEPGSSVACLLVNDSHQMLTERLRDSGHRVLAVNRYTGRRSIPSVRIDDAGGVEQAVDHLVTLGHQRIGFLRGTQGNLDAAERQRGFAAATKRHGLREAVEAGEGFNEACGYEAASALLSSPHPPTALICASDLAAIGAIKAARDSGRFLPHDLSVVGFGDFSVAPYITPSLTTIRQPRMELGQAAAEALIHLSRDEDVPGSVLEAGLILRESTVPRAAARTIVV